MSEPNARRHLDVDLHPTVCNLCGGEVEYIENYKVYGQSYGSGWMYRCKKCDARVGTHKPHPTEALGILSDSYMQKAKKMCHEAIDELWKGQRNEKKARTAIYADLAERLGLDFESCHIGYFDLELLRSAYRAIMDMREERGLPRKPEGVCPIKRNED